MFSTETMTGFPGSLGVVTSEGGRRRWPDDVKARVVADTLLPGATVNPAASGNAAPPGRIGIVSGRVLLRLDGQHRLQGWRMAHGRAA